jgi:signal transduction histidine kinase
VSGVLLLVAAAWTMAAVVAARARIGRLAAAYGLLAALHVAAAAWPPAAALVVAGWLGYAVTLPAAKAGTLPRRVALAGAVPIGVVWTVVPAVHGQATEGTALAWAAVVVAAAGAVAVALRCRKAATAERRVLQWVAAASVLAAGCGLVVLALHVLVGVPDSPGSWFVATLALVPLAQALALWPAAAGGGEAALVESIVVTGLAALVVAVYLVVVVGLNRAPTGDERDILLTSIMAAIVVAVLALPARVRLVHLARGLVGTRAVSAEEVVATFGARMSRAVPMDELMLQLAESLRATVAPAGAEIWVGADGVLSRAVSVPTRSPGRIVLAPRERVVVGRGRIGGTSWSSVWLPDLVEPGHLRVAPVAHLGELLGLVVVRRDVDAPDFTEDEDRQVVELARQLGLALHNVRLDSALQASLEELEQRNAELQASRLRIVTASDETRRGIERNLHDGAQQHLVALAVKLGLAGQIAEEEPSEVVPLLEELRADVRTTIAELRELAHGIYPPLLRDQGLAEALRTAAARSALPCVVRVDLPGRYPQEVETAAYFCCLEALQNAGKHAGAQARVTVEVGTDGGDLWFEVRDDGAGFALAELVDAGPGSLGHGFVNMQDRLGAIGGRLTVVSAPEEGTTVRGTIPAASPASAPPASAPPANPSPDADRERLTGRADSSAVAG